MAFSKITLNGETLIDVTGDTVIANHLIYGDTATGANGEQITGTLQLDIAAIVDEERNFVGPGTQRIEVTNLTVGTVVTISTTVTEAQGASWDVLTSTTPIGSTIRQIVGGTLSDNTPSLLTFVMEGSETAFVIRLMINPSTGNRKYWTVKGVELI